MKSVFIVEMYAKMEAYDDDRTDFDGEVKGVWEGLFFLSAEEAWAEVKSRFVKDEYDGYRFMGEYIDPSGGDVCINPHINERVNGVYDEYQTYFFDDEKKVAHFNLGSELITGFRVRELKRWCGFHPTKNK